MLVLLTLGLSSATDQLLDEILPTREAERKRPAVMTTKDLGCGRKVGGEESALRERGGGV